MSCAVFYYSSGGHTKALAEAISKRLGVKLCDVSQDLDIRTDIVFIGSSLYAGRPAKEVTDFINRNSANIAKIACFGTSCSGKSTFPKIRDLAETMGIEVEEKYFNCPGQFLFLHKGRPTAEDCENAADFAVKIIRNMK